jgi:hypothetical protein
MNHLKKFPNILFLKQFKPFFNNFKYYQRLKPYSAQFGRTTTSFIILATLQSVDDVCFAKFSIPQICVKCLLKLVIFRETRFLRKFFFLLNYEYFKIRPSEQAHSPLPTLRFMSTFSRRSIKDVF